MTGTIRLGKGREAGSEESYGDNRGENALIRCGSRKQGGLNKAAHAH